MQEIIIGPFNRASGFTLDAELLEDTFWCQLFNTFGGVPILPRLKKATVLGANPYRSIDTGAFRLLNLSIHELKLDFPHSFENELKQVKEALTVCFLSIQRLEALSVEVLDLTSVLDLETLPRLHPHLRFLKLYHCAAPIELSCLRILTTLPNLGSLNFHLRSPDSEPPHLPMTFPELRNLAVTCGEFAAIGALLDRVNAPQLQALIIDEAHQDSNNMIQKFPGYFGTLVTKCLSLTTFKWYSRQVLKKGVNDSGQWNSGGRLAELLAPLLSHRTMRHFSAAFQGSIVPYTSADFCTIAEAWPDIETFNLGDAPYGDGSWEGRHADLESIVAFAHHCPNLRTLRLPAVRFDPFSARASELAHDTPAPHWLCELLVIRIVYPKHPGVGGYFPASAPAELRTVMKNLFPIATMRGF